MAKTKTKNTLATVVFELRSRILELEEKWEIRDVFSDLGNLLAYWLGCVGGPCLRCITLST